MPTITIDIPRVILEQRVVEISQEEFDRMKDMDSFDDIAETTWSLMYGYEKNSLHGLGPEFIAHFFENLDSTDEGFEAFKEVKETEKPRFFIDSRDSFVALRDARHYSYDPNCRELNEGTADVVEWYIDHSLHSNDKMDVLIQKCNMLNGQFKEWTKAFGFKKNN